MKGSLIVLFMALLGAGIYISSASISITDNNPSIQTVNTNTSLKPKAVENESQQLAKLDAKKNTPAKPQHPIETSDLKTQIQIDRDEFQRYAQYNKRFESQDQDPTLMRHAIDERQSFSEDKEYSLVAWTDKKYYLKHDSVLVQAQLQNQQEQVLLKPIKVTLMDDNRAPIRSFTIEASSDNPTQQTTLDLSALDLEKTGIYMLGIEQAELEIKDTISFIVSEPNIELTGEFRDFINEQGDLIIEAQVKTSASEQHSQMFYIQASLYSDTEVAIGATQVSKAMGTGTHWLALSFDGLMILDTQESGPFKLKHVSLAKVTMPMERAPLQQPQYSTQAYAYDEFY